ncbi:MAG: TRAP transporter large permease subunit [Rhizobiaceae bacterium]|nr:TRAP transporter large permease subunit [Rhizobiaceae bacterium]
MDCKSGCGPVFVIPFFILVYLVLGCFLDTISMMLITLPGYLPIAENLGYAGFERPDR